MPGSKSTPLRWWEKFLDRHGVLLDSPIRWDDVPAGYLPVVVHGMYGTGASLCRSRAEYDAVVGPHRRPKPGRTVYLVEKEDIEAHWPAEKPETAKSRRKPQGGKKAAKREERA